MPQLNPDSFASQIFWLFLTFAVLYFFVAKVFVPRIGRVVEGRKDSIKGNVEKADAYYSQQKAISDDIVSLLDESRRETATFKKQIIKKTEALFNAEVKRIDKEVSSKMVSEEQKLSQFKAKLENQISDLSQSIAVEVKSILLDSHNARKN